MNQSRMKLFLFLTIISFSLFACGKVSNNENSNGSGETNNVEVNIPVNNLNVENNNNSVEPASPDTGFSLENPSLFIENSDTNYTLNFNYYFYAVDSNGENINGNMSMTGSHSISPDTITEYTISFYGLANVNNRYLHYVETSDKIYVDTAETGCLSYEKGEYNSPLEYFSYSQKMFVGNSEIKNEDLLINGVLTKLYRVKNENISASNFNPTDTIDLISGMLWVAPEGYIVKLELDGTGSNLSFTGDPELIGSVYYDLNFTPTLDPADISIPDGCDQ